MEKYDVTNNTSLNRFEVQDSGETAFLDYKISEKELSHMHTEVPANIGGKGIANALAAQAFEFAAAQDLKVLNYCAFINTYIKRHPALLNQMGEKK